MATHVERKSILLSKYTSRLNKLWLVIAWRHDGMYIEWRTTSRMEFQFEPRGEWFKAKSYEDDIKPFLQEK